jgi:hypothetical protein
MNEIERSRVGHEAGPADGPALAEGGAGGEGQVAGRRYRKGRTRRQRPAVGQGPLAASVDFIDTEATNGPFDGAG